MRVVVMMIIRYDRFLVFNNMLTFKTIINISKKLAITWIVIWMSLYFWFFYKNIEHLLFTWWTISWLFSFWISSTERFSFFLCRYLDLAFDKFFILMYLWLINLCFIFVFKITKARKIAFDLSKLTFFQFNSNIVIFEIAKHPLLCFPV